MGGNFTGMNNAQGNDLLKRAKDLEDKAALKAKKAEDDKNLLAAQNQEKSRLKDQRSKGFRGGGRGGLMFGGSQTGVTNNTGAAY